MNMGTHINNLLKQAIRTFGLKDRFQHNLENLRTLMDRTSDSDVGLKGHELLGNEIWSKPRKAPVSYIEIFEDDLISVGIFILKPGMKLPLHDHPHMYGLIKVLAGSVKVTSYTVLGTLGENTLEVGRHSPIIVSEQDKSCMLEPFKQNLHEIESVNGAAAFLDILSPPYETMIPNIGLRKCSYYASIADLGVNKLRLKATDSPPWFWSDTYPYRGPKINIQDLLLRDVQI